MKYEIVRDEEYLKTWLPLKGFTDFGLSNEIEIVFLETQDINVDVPHKTQIKALEFIIDNSDLVLTQLSDFIYDQREELEEVYGQFDTESREGFPNLHSAIDIFKYLQLSTIYVHFKALENISYLGLFGDCSWDSEHAFGVVFHKGRMVDFGDWNTAHSFHEEQSSLSISDKYFIKSLPVQRKQLFESAKDIQIDDLTQHLELFNWLIDQRAIYGYRSTKIDLSDKEKVALITTLESLDLSSRNLKELPESMGLMKNLNYLDVGGNEIQVLPDFISEFKQLESLDVSLNSITHLPDSFFKLSRLDYLNLSLNKFDEFPLVIEKLKRLKNIDISDNKVESIPEWIDQLQHLKDFRISDNKLRSLPNNIGNIDSLEILNASGNRFSFFQKRKIKSRLSKDLNYDIEND